MDPHSSSFLEENAGINAVFHGQFRKTDLLAYSLLAAVFLFRLIYAAFLPIVPDEAYYWDWSRDLSWGYYDHPPMIAWLIFLSRKVFGETLPGVRSAVIACGSLASVVSYLLAKKYVVKTSSLLLWIVISNSVVLFCVGSLLATPDIPLVLFWSLSLFFGYKAVFEPSSISWIILGIAAGLGLLSKYTFILFPISLFIFLAVSRDHRAWFGRWQPYAAACIALIVFLPNLIWNQQHGWQAVMFQTSHGLNKHIALHLDTLGDFIAGQLGVLSIFPFVLLAWALWFFLKASTLQGKIVYLVSFCIVPFGFFLIASLQKKVEANWTACAYVSGIILVSLFWENLDPAKNKSIRRFAVASAAIAAVAAATILAHFQIPFLPLPPQNDPSAQVRGWKELAIDIDGIRERIDPHRASPLCTQRYQEASVFGFYLPDHPKMFALNTNSRDNQYSLWPQRRPAAGSSVFLLHSTDDWFLDTIIKKNFSIIALRDRATLRQSKTITNDWGIYSGVLK